MLVRPEPGRSNVDDVFIGNTASPDAPYNENCLAYCAASGYIFAGLEYYGQCFCGNALSNGLSLSAPGNCSTACSGNVNEQCGGGGYLTLYQNTRAFVPPFNPYARTNVAAYFGHTNGALSASLQPVCDNPNINIVILGYVRQWDAPGTYPWIDLHSSCLSRNGAIYATTTNPACPQLATWVANCQSVGKKVFLSIGGQIGVPNFDNATQARQAADTLWEFFGPTPSNLYYRYRPLGVNSIDGIDLGQ